LGEIVKQIRRSQFLIAAVIALASLSLEAQAPIRVNGIIAASDGKMITVRDQGGKTVDIQVGDKAEIVATQPIALGDIKPGDFLAVTSMKRADGTLTALEVRRFPKPINPGHRPFAGRDDRTMTNATVSATVQSTRGRELTMSYEGGSQKIVVPDNAAVSTLVAGNRSQLVSGASVNLTASPGGDGKLAAVRIQVTAPR
jgi:hypothetical protein